MKKIAVPMLILLLVQFVPQVIYAETDSPFTEDKIVIENNKDNADNETTPATIGRVTVRIGLNVRTGPWQTIIGGLVYDTRIQVLGKLGDWYQINFRGRKAYVHSDCVAIESGDEPDEQKAATTSASPAKKADKTQTSISSSLTTRKTVKYTPELGKFSTELNKTMSIGEQKIVQGPDGETYLAKCLYHSYQAKTGKTGKFKAIELHVP